MGDGFGASTIRQWVFVHPLIFLAAVGLIIRSLISVLFTHSYDIAYWGYIIENIQSNSGLYELPGYYYTPVWGYFISSIGFVMNYLFGIDVFGIESDSLIPSQDVSWEYYMDLVTTVEFSLVFKAVFTLIDLAISYVLYLMVMERTGDRQKASIAFGLWFLCPLTIYTSCVHAMFDGLSVLTLLLTVYFLMKGNYLLAGCSFSMAVLSKFFPAYLIFLFVAYILVKESGDIRKFAKSLSMSILGAAVMFLVIYTPDIVNGTIWDSLNFVFNRVDSIGAGEESFWDSLTSNGYTIVIMLQPVIIFLEVLLAYYYQKGRSSKSNNNDRFMMYCMLGATSVFLWTPAPTYMMIIIPFVIYHVLVSDSRYKLSLIALLIVPTLYAIVMHNFSDLFAANVFLHIVSPEFILNGIEWLDSVTILGMSNQSLINLILGALETLAIYSVFITYVHNRRMDSKVVSNGSA
ncbi:hypothetical protein JS82_09380 [Methanomassiliicoccaceae archaeon DOK]|nr:hypothetical protein JS82_09380 [Methanomassiliicoccaceae archaeon DOK]